MKDTIEVGPTRMPMLDYVVGAAAILGIRDSGKTVTGKGLAEQIMDQKFPIIVFDAVGKWRWLKVASNTARGRGYPVVVAGGLQPDLPLTPQSAPEIVRSAVRERIPLVIDLFDKKLSKADWRRIVQDSIRIIHYENEGGPLHVFLEEAAEFVPQQVQDGLVYAEIEKLVRMGGNAQVGITLINQRSQEVNKAVLENCSTLILGRQVGNKAIEAVGKWVDRLDKTTSKVIMETLPKMKAGEAYVWTTQNPERPVWGQFDMCRSMHPDRRTPPAEIKQAKAADPSEFIKRLSTSIPKVIEQAKANDPAELKKEITRLQKELAKPTPAAAPAEPKIVEVPVLDDKKFEALRREVEIAISNLKVYEAQGEVIRDRLTQVHNDLVGIRNTIKPQVSGPPGGVFQTPVFKKDISSLQKLDLRKIMTDNSLKTENNGTLSKGEREVLNVIAGFGNDGCDHNTIAVFTGYKKTSRVTYIGHLRQKGYVSTEGDRFIATQEGVDALGLNFKPLPQGEELQAYWRQNLPTGELRVFEVLLGAYPRYLTGEEIEERTGYKKTSRVTYIGNLNARHLIKKSSDGFVLAPILF